MEKVAVPTERESDVRELVGHLVALVEHTDIGWRAAPETIPLPEGLPGVGNYLAAPALQTLNGQLAVIQNQFTAEKIMKALNLAAIDVGTLRTNMSPMTFIEGQTLKLCYGHETCTDTYLTSELATLMAQKAPSEPLPQLRPTLPRQAPEQDDGGCSSGGAGPGGIALLLALWSVALLARHNRRRTRGKSFRATTV